MSERAVKTITPPKAGTTSARVWALADELSALTGLSAKRSDVLAAAEKEGINRATAATQFGLWRTFHGIKD